MKKIIAYVFLFAILTGSAEGQEQFEVNAATLNMRSGPSKDYTVIKSLTKGDLVTLIERENDNWWLVESNNDRGYVFASLLIIKDNSKTNWERKNYESGTAPDCENIVPEYDYNLDNYLKVQIGSNTDVVIKVMQKGFGSESKCVRIAYVRSEDVYYIRNIPEGIYYLKIAYGKDWQQRIVNYQCYGKFARNAKYEKGSETLDFKVRDTFNGQQIPSFELFLDIVASKYERSSYHSNNINETEFNK